MTAYKITYADGTQITTSMAAGTTLADAKNYFLGQWIDIGVYPHENMQRVISVEAV